MAFTLSTIYKAVDKYTPVLKKMELATNTFSLNAEYGINKANRAISKIQGVTQKSVNSILNLRNAAIVTGTVMIGKQVWEYSQSIAKLGDDAANTARMLGITAEALQELQFAGDIQNVTAEQLTTSLKFLNKNIGQLKLGTGSLYANLKKSNPALAEQLRNVENNEQAFNLITEALNKLPNQFERTALAQAAFGKGGTDMLKMTDLGVDGISKLREEARKYGGVISNDVANSMDEYLDTQARMKMAIQGLKIQLMSGLIPVLENIAKKITNWIGNNKDLIKSKISEWANKITQSIQWLTENFNTIIRVVKIGLVVFAGLFAVNTALKAVSLSMSILKAATMAYNIVLGIFYATQSSVPVALTSSSAAMHAYSIATGIAEAVTWLFSAALWSTGIPEIVLGIMALVAGIVLLIVKWKEITNWVKTSDSFFAKLIRATIYPLILAFKLIKAAIGWVIDKFREMLDWFKQTTAFKILLKIIQPIKIAFQALGNVFSWVWDKIKSLWEWIKKIAGVVSAPIMKLINAFSGGTQKELNVNTTENPVNTAAAATETTNNNINESINNKLAIELTNKTDKNANIKTNNAKVPFTTNTFY